MKFDYNKMYCFNINDNITIFHVFNQKENVVQMDFIFRFYFKRNQYVLSFDTKERKIEKGTFFHNDNQITEANINDYRRAIVLLLNKKKVSEYIVS